LTQRYVKRAVTSEQSIVASEFWTEVQENGSDQQKIPETSHRYKGTRDIQYEDKEKRIDQRSNSKTQIKLLYILHVIYIYIYIYNVYVLFY